MTPPLPAVSRLCLLLLSSRTSRGLSLLFRTRPPLACLGIGALSLSFSLSLSLYFYFCFPCGSVFHSPPFPRKWAPALCSLHGCTSCTFLGSLCFLSAAFSSSASSSGERVATLGRDLATILVSFSPCLGTCVFFFLYLSISLSLSLSLWLSPFSLSLCLCLWYHLGRGRALQ